MRARPAPRTTRVATTLEKSNIEEGTPVVGVTQFYHPGGVIQHGSHPSGPSSLSPGVDHPGEPPPNGCSRLVRSYHSGDLKGGTSSAVVSSSKVGPPPQVQRPRVKPFSSKPMTKGFHSGFSAGPNKKPPQTNSPCTGEVGRLISVVLAFTGAT